ncbi:MAG: LacI family DNA-binding transcriptional regulator [Azospirillaceae bacterium]
MTPPPTPSGSDPAGPIRLQEVAEAAGVSTITVSRCLNNPTRVSAATRARVLEVAGRLGYIPNRLASSLVSARTRVIGAIVPTIGNPIHSETLQAATDLLGPAGYQLLLGDTGYSIAREAELVQTFLGHRVDGMLITGARHTRGCAEALGRAGVPVVETFEFTPNPIDCNVGFSNLEAGASLVRYLAGRGRRHIAFVEHARIDDSRMNARRDGAMAAGREIGQVIDLHAIDSDPGTGIGGDVIDTILADRPATDAVIFAGHQVAVGAIRHAIDRGIAVPDRLAIVSFGDSPISRWIRPALTTVRFPMQEMGREAARLLLGRLTGEQPAGSAINLGFEIMMRDSA